MSYSENGGTPFTMPVAPYGGGYGGNDLFGGNGAWWLIILLLFMNNGWGNGFGFGGGNGVGSEVQRGFDQNAIMNGINGINAAITGGMNAMTSSFQECCCENRLGIADLKYAVATENCADRAAMNEGFMNLMVAENANTQRIVDTINAGDRAVLDKICQLELDAKNERIADLQAQLNEANRRASQNEQTAQILAGQRTLANEVEQYLSPTPRPAWIVQNPNCCTQNFGYGCGSAA